MADNPIDELAIFNKGDNFHLSVAIVHHLFHLISKRKKSDFFQSSDFTNMGQVIVRHYGLCSNAHRGKMRKIQQEKVVR